MISEPVFNEISTELNLSFPSRLNSNINTLAEHLSSWAHQWARIPESRLATWRENRYERLVARMYPTAEPPLLLLTAEAVLWLFQCDDYMDPGHPGDNRDHAVAVARQVEHILDGHVTNVPEGPLTAALWRLCRELRPLVCDTGWQRFTESVRELVNALAHEVGTRISGYYPDIAEYVLDRRATSGWKILTMLIELNCQILLSDEIRKSTEYTSLYNASVDLATGINDLLSLPKEMASGEHHNLTVLIMNSEKCDLEAAVRQTEKVIKLRLSGFIVARERFLSKHAPGDISGNEFSVVREYVTGLENLIKGSFDWSLESGRYQRKATR